MLIYSNRSAIHKGIHPNEPESPMRKCCVAVIFFFFKLTSNNALIDILLSKRET